MIVTLNDKYTLDQLIEKRNTRLSIYSSIYYNIMLTIMTNTS